MDLNELLVFTRVVQTGSFTAAARALEMPKSSVSKKVADLELRLGARLLQRTTRKLSLTDAGRTYFERAARIVAEIEETEQAVNRLQTTPRGLLRVTVPLSFGALGPIVTTYLQEHHDVQVELVCTDRIVDLVEEGFDLAIRAGPLEDSALVARAVGGLRRVLVAAPGYLRRAGTPAVPEDLATHACIAFGAGASPRTWTLQRRDAAADAATRGETNTSERSIRLSPRLVVNDFEMMLEVTLAGVGIAFMLESVVEHDLRTGKLRRVLDDWCSPTTVVHALYPTSRQLSPKVIAFMDEVLRRFGGSVPTTSGRKHAPR